MQEVLLVLICQYIVHLLVRFSSWFNLVGAVRRPQVRRHSLYWTTSSPHRNHPLHSPPHHFHSPLTSHTSLVATHPHHLFQTTQLYYITHTIHSTCMSHFQMNNVQLNFPESIVTVLVEVYVWYWMVVKISSFLSSLSFLSPCLCLWPFSWQMAPGIFSPSFPSTMPASTSGIVIIHCCQTLLHRSTHNII